MTVADKIAVFQLSELVQFGTPLELVQTARQSVRVRIINSSRMKFIEGTINPGGNSLVLST